MAHPVEKHTLGRTQRQQIDAGLDKELHTVLDPLMRKIMEKSEPRHLM